MPQGVVAAVVRIGIQTHRIGMQRIKAAGRNPGQGCRVAGDLRQCFAQVPPQPVGHLVRGYQRGGQAVAIDMLGVNGLAARRVYHVQRDPQLSVHFAH